MATILIVALRRSGTTALWRCFQRLQGFSGFDEPFNPKLRGRSRNDPKGTLHDLLDVHDSNTDEWPHAFSPIEPQDEAAPELDTRAEGYLRWLMAKASTAHVVLDITRCGFKLTALKRVLGPCVLVHLSRDPIDWVRSHLYPSERGWSYRRQRMLARISGFRTKDMPRDYALDRVVGSRHFQQRLSACGVERSDFRRLMAIQKLYLLWLLHETSVSSLAPILWPNTHYRLVYEAFSVDPVSCVREVLAADDVWKPEREVRHACEHVLQYRPVKGPAGLTRRIADGIREFQSRYPTTMLNHGAAALRPPAAIDHTTEIRA